MANKGGLEGAVVADITTSFIDGAVGKLIYSGYTIEDLAENGGAVSFSMGKTIQDGKLGAFRQRAQLLDQGPGRPVEGDIDQRFSGCLGLFDQIEREWEGQAPRFIIPDHIVADEQPVQAAVQFPNSGGHPFLFSEHGQLSGYKVRFTRPIHPFAAKWYFGDPPRDNRNGPIETLSG